MIASPAGLWCRVSPPWLLRALLLLKVDVDAQLLREKYLENEPFAFYRENTEPRVRELSWDKPPEPRPKQRKWTPSTTTDSWVLTPSVMAKQKRLMIINIHALSFPTRIAYNKKMA